MPGVSFFLHEIPVIILLIAIFVLYILQIPTFICLHLVAWPELGDSSILVIITGVLFIIMIHVIYTTLHLLYIVKYGAEMPIQNVDAQNNQTQYTLVASNEDDKAVQFRASPSLEFYDNIHQLKKTVLLQQTDELHAQNNINASVPSVNTVDNDINAIYQSPTTRTHRLNGNLPFEDHFEIADDPLTSFNSTLSQPQYDAIYQHIVNGSVLDQRLYNNMRDNALSTPNKGIYRVCQRCSHLQPIRCHHYTLPGQIGPDEARDNNDDDGMLNENKGNKYYPSKYSQCYLLFDHYCVALNVVIDFRNRRSFLLLLLYAVISCLYYLCLYPIWFVKILQRVGSYGDDLLFIKFIRQLMDISYQLAVYLCGPLLILFCFYCYLWVYKNMTTIQLIHNVTYYLNSNKQQQKVKEDNNHTNSRNMSTYLYNGCYNYGSLYMNYVSFFHDFIDSYLIVQCILLPLQWFAFNHYTNGIGCTILNHLLYCQENIISRQQNNNNTKTQNIPTCKHQQKMIYIPLRLQRQLYKIEQNDISPELIHQIIVSYFDYTYNDSKQFHYFPLNGISHYIMAYHRKSILKREHFVFDDIN